MKIFYAFQSQRGESMKRTSILISLSLGTLMIFLTGCGSKTPAAETNATGRLNANYENALPVENQLILGTLLLEDTDHALTTEQAAVLLPMWQMMKELESSDTAATQEKGGLIEQIQETMTSEQIRAIADMKLTQKELFAYMQKAGLMQRPQQSGTQAASGSTSGNFPGNGGGAPPAGFEGGGRSISSEGGGGPSGGTGSNLTSEQIATMQARRASGGSGGNTSALLDALLQLLETKQGKTQPPTPIPSP
jgi:hypothetical protein